MTNAKSSRASRVKPAPKSSPVGIEVEPRSSRWAPDLLSARDPSGRELGREVGVSLRSLGEPHPRRAARVTKKRDRTVVVNIGDSNQIGLKTLNAPQRDRSAERGLGEEIGPQFAVGRGEIAADFAILPLLPR